MSTTQQQKKKTRKSYEELLNEVRSIMSKTAAVYIPELCETLRTEQPELTNKEIRRQIELDVEGIWKPTTVLASLPSWIFDEAIVKKIKKGWETRNANKLNSSTKIIHELANVELSEPKIERPVLDIDVQLEDAELTKYGDKGKTLLTKYGDITRPIAELFEGLTEHEYMPHVDEDVILDHIKPTREYRRGIVLELDEEKRTTLHNWLAWVDLAIHDMLGLIQEADK